MNVNPKRYQDAQDKQNREAINVGAIVRVIAFDPANMRVDVQPLSKHLEAGVYQSQPPVLGVPVTYTKSGGFVFRPWIAAGDIGTVLYVDHDIDRVVAEGREIEPNTERNHSTSDAVYVGSIVLGNAPLQGLPDDAAVIASEDGGTVIGINSSGIIMRAKNVEIKSMTIDAYNTEDATFHNGLTVDGKLQVNGNAEITQDLSVGGDLAVGGDAAVVGDATVGGDLTVSQTATVSGDVNALSNLLVSKNAAIRGNADIGGELSVTGNVLAQNNVTVAGSLVLAGINMNAHTHGGITAGGDNSGPPES